MERKAYFHLPGLFEFYDFYKEFLALYAEHRDWFYDWAEIGSIYGSPADCIWGGGRVGFGEDDPKKVAALLKKYGISARLTFSNSLLTEDHLSDRRCNDLCTLFHSEGNGIIVYSDLLLEYLRQQYPDNYFVSSTTKVLTDFDEFRTELDREEYRFTVPDFRLNNQLEKLRSLTQKEKDKVEFLCNECCFFGCTQRKECYENVSAKSLGLTVEDHVCHSPESQYGYRFSKAMQNPGFIGVNDIRDIYLPMGFSNFKIEGRSLGSAVLLEFLLHYMTREEYQLNVREELYLDSMLDLF